MERMNYINRPKECYTQEEWIEYLEESIRELRKEKENLKKEKGEIRQRLLKLEKAQAELSRVKENKELKKELSKYKKYYDRDKEELMESCYSLAKENDELKDTNKNLKSDLAYNRTMLDNVQAEYESQVNINKRLKEENDRLKNNAMEDMRVQTKLEEKIRFLEECLDNKEKVNKQLREEIQQRINAVNNM